MLTLAKQTDYVTYNPNTRVCHFLNGIMDPSLAQAKLSLEANREQYSGDFDATVEYLMNQVTHQQVNQQLHVASVDSGAPSRLKTKDERSNNLKMPLIEYSNKQWDQLSWPRKQVSASAIWPCKIGIADTLVNAVVAKNVSVPVRTVGPAMGVAAVMVVNPTPREMSTVLLWPPSLPFLTALT